MRRFLLGALLAALSFLFPNDHVKAVSEPGWRPDRAMIDKIEGALAMPAGAAPVSAYRRRYGGVLEDGRRVIWGVYLLPQFALDDPPVAIVDYRPVALVQDGGCAVVTVKYDAEAGRVLWIACNGEA